MSASLRAQLQASRLRYRDAPASDRHYVAIKLRTDPILTQLLACPWVGGDAVDGGCGRGQLGLALLDGGHITSLVGFDFDTRKVGVANRAANGQARFWEGDLRDAAFPAADTVLLIDVMHYLDTEVQVPVLQRAAAALRPGGCLVIRDIDGRSPWGGWLARSLERLGVRLGMNQAQSLGFSPFSGIESYVKTLGLEVTRLPEPPGLHLANAVLVARRSR